MKILKGKENYDTVTIGIDPGQVFGVAIIADGSIIDGENCFSVKETLNKIRNTLRTIDLSRSNVTVKIGSGVPIYKELLEVFDSELPPQVTLEIVGEAGTNRYTREVKNRRGLRHMVSATRIAGRAGYVYSRRNTVEQDS